MIYFIKAGDYIKVGYSKSESSFKYRLSSYKTSCPFEIEIISKIDGGIDLEKDILNYFIEYHCRGEWFNYHISIENFAKTPYKIPKSILKKPLHKGNKEILEKLSEILELYTKGTSLRELDEMFGIPRARLTKYIPDDLKRSKNELVNIRKRSDNVNNLPVKCVETGEEFISIAEASRKFNTTVTCIQRVCQGDRKSTQGKTFIFLEKDLK